MTKKELRIAVAKDVLQSLSKIKPTNMTYFAPAKGVNVRQLTIDEKNSSKKIASRLQEGCQVCALGACFISLVKIDNKFNFKQNPNVGDSAEMWDRLKSTFDLDQLYLIESVFEGWSSSYIGKYKSAKGRMKAIMENIIANDGEFVNEKPKKTR